MLFRSQLAAAFGAKVVLHSRSAIADAGGAEVEPNFEALLRRADILSLHCPLTPETRGMIGAAQLQLMPPGALLINTARGALVDEAALSEALSNAIVRGNCEERGKWVDVRAELLPDTIRVSVTDEGTGFDPSSVPEPIHPDQLGEANGRGLYLIRKLVDAVQFNERGNSICMILRRP